MLIARLEIIAQKASAKRRAREKSFNLRIAVVQKRLDRNRAKLETATSETVRLQASFDQISAACEASTALSQCKKDAIKTCNQEKRSCGPTRNSCKADTNQSCRGSFTIGSADYRNCLTSGYNSCKDSYNACFNVDCQARANTTCGG
jgi:exonuclease VII large subunit